MKSRFINVLLVLAIGTMAGVSSAHGDVVSLADIVGGGDGSGIGTDSGIDISTGLATTSHSNLIGDATNLFTQSTNPFVDGVFIPDGGTGGANSIQVSSTGLMISGISDSTGFSTDSNHSWDHIWNGDNTSTSTNLVGTQIGAHANKGITFDLDAIEANFGEEVVLYNLTAATGNNGSSNPDFYVFIDGVLAHSASLSGADQSTNFSGSFGAADRFLTLVTSSNGSINDQWANWNNASVSTQSVPEPSTFALLALAGGVSIFRRRRSVV